MEGKDIKKLNSRRIIIPIIILIFIAVFSAYIIWGNSTLVLSEITFASNKIPENFDGYKIAHVSDLHNTEIGEGNCELIAMLKSAEPDIIAITGDIFDSRKTDVDVSVHFAAEAVKIAPCYYVTGNHEEREEEALAKLIEGLEEVGVNVLRNRSVKLQNSGDYITLIGIDDPVFGGENDKNSTLGDVLSNYIENSAPKDDSFKLLLSHRPEYINIYEKQKIDLVLSGHAHGGQIRLPFIGGLAAPGQGIFPKYTCGMYEVKDTAMIVSRGIGNSIFPFRVNNRPEVVIITLRTQVN